MLSRSQRLCSIFFVSFYGYVAWALPVLNKSIPDLVRANHAMVVTGDRQASKAAWHILKAGGNAIDAAIAAALVLNLVEPQSSGIGGGAFAMVYDPSRDVISTYDGREVAPAAIKAEDFALMGNEKKTKNMKNKGFVPSQEAMRLGRSAFYDRIIGGASVGVPSSLSMYHLMHQDQGHIAWSILFDEAIGLATHGFVVSKRLAHMVASDPYLKLDRQASSYFFDHHGRPMLAGRLWTNHPFASTLKQIQQHGIEPFYRGQIASDMIDKLHHFVRRPSAMSMTDLANYRTIKRDPICVVYQNRYKICGMLPPSSGGIAIGQMLGFWQSNQSITTDIIHGIAEVGKLAFADRNTYVADPAWVKVPVKGMLDPSYIAHRANLLHGQRALKTPVNAGYPKGWQAWPVPGDHSLGTETTHLAVIDANGMAVTMTASLEQGFGSHIMVDGFLLNNQLSDFSDIDKQSTQAANRLAGGKRPRSSMAPTMVFDQKNHHLRWIIGSPGGPHIIAYVFQTLIGLIDQHLPLNQAINLPHVSNLNGITYLEKDTDIINHIPRLRTKGHQIKITNLTSGLNVIAIEHDGTIHAAADKRRSGFAMGY